MKTIKINREYLLRSISKILLSASVMELFFTCKFVAYESENPKLKNMIKK